LFQIADEGRISGHRPLAPAARLADMLDAAGGWIAQFLQANVDGAPRDAGRTRHGRYAAIAEDFRLSRSMEPPLAFVQKKLQAGKPLFDRVNVYVG
jgi:hypothetical protein